MGHYLYRVDFIGLLSGHLLAALSRHARVTVCTQHQCTGAVQKLDVTIFSVLGTVCASSQQPLAIAASTTHAEAVVWFPFVVEGRLV